MSDANFHHQCQLCEEQPVTSYCQTCTRFLCKTCTKAHVRIVKECTEQAVIDLSTVRTWQQESIASLKTDVLELQSTLEKESAEEMESYKEDEKAVLALCKQAKCNILDAVDAHFARQEKQIKDLNGARIKRQQDLHQQRQERVAGLLQQLTEQQKLDVVKTAPTWKTTEEKMRKSLEQIREIRDVDTSEYVLDNTQAGSEAFHASQAFSVSWGKNIQVQKSIEKEDDALQGPPHGYGWQFQGPLKLLHTSEIYGNIRGLLMVDDTLWCFSEDKIQLCNVDGNVCSQISAPNLKGLRSATHVVDVVVVCIDAGLLVFKKNGQYHGTINSENYQCIHGYRDILITLHKNKLFQSFIWDREQEVFVKHTDQIYIPNGNDSLANCKSIAVANNNIFVTIASTNMYVIQADPPQSKSYKLREYASNFTDGQSPRFICDVRGNEMILCTRSEETLIMHNTTTQTNSLIAVPDTARLGRCLAVSGEHKRVYILVEGDFMSPHILHVYTCA